jgi:thioredoxin 1
MWSPGRAAVYNDPMKILAFAFVSLCCVFAVSGEEIVLKNGKVVEASVWKEIGGTVILKGPDGILLNIKKEEIDQKKTDERKKTGVKEQPADSTKQSKPAKPPKTISKEYLESLREKYDLGQGSYGEAYELNLKKAAKYKDFSIREDPDFQRNVLKANMPVIVDFWAAWCGPCRTIAPHVESVEKEFRDRAVVYRVNIDEQPEIASFYKVDAIPTLVYFNNGEEVDRIIGAASKEVISAHLKPLLK